MKKKDKKLSRKMIAGMLSPSEGRARRTPPWKKLTLAMTLDSRASQIPRYTSQQMPATLNRPHRTHAATSMRSQFIQDFRTNCSRLRASLHTRLYSGLPFRRFSLRPSSWFPLHSDSRHNHVIFVPSVNEHIHATFIPSTLALPATRTITVAPLSSSSILDRSVSYIPLEDLNTTEQDSMKDGFLFISKTIDFILMTIPALTINLSAPFTPSASKCPFLTLKDLGPVKGDSEADRSLMFVSQECSGAGHWWNPRNK